MSDYQEIEWRVWYQRAGRNPEMRDGFKEPNLNWGAYFHNIRPTEVIRWESRWNGRGPWLTDSQGGPQPCYAELMHRQRCLRAYGHRGGHSPYGEIVP